MTDVVAFGECMVEIGLTGPRQAALGYAGDTFTAAVYLRRQGLSAAYASAIGDGDPFSAGIMRLMSDEGVDASLMRKAPGRLPGVYAFDRDDAGERRFFYWRAESPARDYFAMTDLPTLQAAVSAAKLVYFSGVTLAIIGDKGRETLGGLLAQAKAAGVAVAYDPNHRPQLWASRELAQAATEAVIPFCSYVSVEDSDLSGLYGDGGEAKPADWAALGPEVILRAATHDITVYSQGSVVRLRHEPPVRALDTTGAGDAFNAGYLAARLKGQDVRAAVLAARRLTNMVVQHIGAIIPRAAMPVVIAAP